MKIKNAIPGRTGWPLKTAGILMSFLCLIGAAGVFAHPHSFVTCTTAFVMDKTGLVGCRQRWVIDQMTTIAVLDAVGTDLDGSLSPQEKAAIRDLTVDSLKAYHYFTKIRINGRDAPVQTITDFSAELVGGRLVYNFLVPCPVVAIPDKRQQVKVAVYDDSFYTYIAYTTEGDASPDPTKDPMFANRQAPAQPGDYERFAKAVGLTKFKGDIRVTGNTEPFRITVKIEDAKDMAYFHNQIVPQTAVIAFEPK
jgi:ABC-type uncharacterized transport system substrate-binding protein